MILAEMAVGARPFFGPAPERTTTTTPPASKPLSAKSSTFKAFAAAAQPI